MRVLDNQSSKAFYRLEAAWAKLDQLSALKAGLAVGATAFLVRLAAIIATQPYRLNENAEPIRIAECLANYGFFGNPFSSPTGPSAFSAPGYPFLLAPVFALLGTGIAGQFVRELLCILASSVQYGLLPAVAAWLGLRKAAGCLAGVAGAVLPMYLWMETRGVFEPAYVGCLLTALLGWSGSVLRRGTDPPPVLYGALWGLGFLFSPVLITVFAGVLAFVAWTRRRDRFSVIARIVLPAAIVVLPWIVRNYVAMGEVFWIRDNFGLELHLSNNPIAGPTLNENLNSAVYDKHPYGSAVERQKVRDEGEVRYCRRRAAEAWSWIRANPGIFARHTLVRTWLFWWPVLNHPAKTVLCALLTFGGILGLFRLIRTRMCGGYLLAATWITFPLVYYLIQADSRYRYPIHATTLLLSCVVLADVIERLLKRTRAAAPQPGKDSRLLPSLH